MGQCTPAEHRAMHSEPCCSSCSCCPLQSASNCCTSQQQCDDAIDMMLPKVRWRQRRTGKRKMGRGASSPLPPLSASLLALLGNLLLFLIATLCVLGTATRAAPVPSRRVVYSHSAADLTPNQFFAHFFSGHGFNVHFVRQFTIIHDEEIDGNGTTNEWETLEWNAGSIRIPVPRPNSRIRLRLRCEATISPYEEEGSARMHLAERRDLQRRIASGTRRHREQKLEVQWRREGAEERQPHEWTTAAEKQMELDSTTWEEQIQFRCLARIPLPPDAKRHATTVSRVLRIGRGKVADEQSDNDNKVEDGTGERRKSSKKKEREQENERSAEAFVSVVHKLQGDSARLMCYTDRRLGERPHEAEWWKNAQGMDWRRETRAWLAEVGGVREDTQGHTQHGFTLEGMRFSLAFMEPADQGLYNCLIRRGSAQGERIQRTLLLVEPTTPLRLERLRVQTVHASGAEEESCFRVNFLLPVGIKMDDAFKWHYLMAFEKMYETEKATASEEEKEVARLLTGSGANGTELAEKQQQTGPPNGTTTAEGHRREDSSSTAIALQRHLHSLPFSLKRGDCRIVRVEDGDDHEGRVRCEFRCCAGDQCGDQFTPGGHNYKIQVGAAIAEDRIMALSQPPAHALSWDERASSALQLDLLYDSVADSLLLRWRSPTHIRGNVEHFRLEAKFPAAESTPLVHRLASDEREFWLKDVQRNGTGQQQQGAEIEVRVVPETRSGAPSTSAMLAHPMEFAFTQFATWMEQFPGGTFTPLAQIVAPFIEFRQMEMGKADLALQWQHPSTAAAIQWLFVRAIGEKGQAEGAWRLNASQRGMELDTELQVGRPHQLCATFASENYPDPEGKPKRVHGLWRCAIVPLLAVDGKLVEKRVEQVEQPTSAEEGTEEESAPTLEPILCDDKTQCRCQFSAAADELTISWEAKQEWTGPNEAKAAVVHYTVDETDAMADEWRSPPMPIAISAANQSRTRQIHLIIVDELQLLPDTDYRVMLEAHDGREERARKQREQQDDSSMKGTYFTCRTPSNLDFPPPTSFRVRNNRQRKGMQFTWRPIQLAMINGTVAAPVGDREVLGYEVHFSRVNDPSKVLGESEQTRKRSTEHHFVEGAQSDEFLLTELIPSGAYEAWLCTRWRDHKGASRCSLRQSQSLIFPFENPAPNPAPIVHAPIFVDSAPKHRSPPDESREETTDGQQTRRHEKLRLYQKSAYQMLTAALLCLFVLLLLATSGLRVHTLWLEGKFGKKWKKAKKRRRDSADDGVEMKQIHSACTPTKRSTPPSASVRQNGGGMMLLPGQQEQDTLLTKAEMLNNNDNKESPTANSSASSFAQRRSLRAEARSVSAHFDEALVEMAQFVSDPRNNYDDWNRQEEGEEEQHCDRMVVVVELESPPDEEGEEHFGWANKEKMPIVPLSRVSTVHLLKTHSQPNCCHPELSNEHLVLRRVLSSPPSAAFPSEKRRTRRHRRFLSLVEGEQFEEMEEARRHSIAGIQRHGHKCQAHENGAKLDISAKTPRKRSQSLPTVRNSKASLCKGHLPILLNQVINNDDSGIAMHPLHHQNGALSSAASSSLGEEEEARSADNEAGAMALFELNGMLTRARRRRSSSAGEADSKASIDSHFDGREHQVATTMTTFDAKATESLPQQRHKYLISASSLEDKEKQLLPIENNNHTLGLNNNNETKRKGQNGSYQPRLIDLFMAQQHHGATAAALSQH